jgi:hypothetical protein
VIHFIEDRKDINQGVSSARYRHVEAIMKVAPVKVKVDGHDLAAVSGE